MTEKVLIEDDPVRLYKLRIVIVGGRHLTLTVKPAAIKVQDHRAVIIHLLLTSGQ